MATPLSPQVLSDPHALLNHLEPALGQTGSIKNSSQDIQRLIRVMKEARILVSRCIILNIIKATKAPSTLMKFMESGGWQILNMWLVEAKKNQNNAMIVEVLQVLQKLPVTLAALKQGTMGKLIKQFSKQEHPDVRRLASELLAKWMIIFKEGQAAKAAVGTKSSESDDSAVKPSTSLKPDKKSEKSSGKKDSKKAKAAAVPPPEASQLPPGPLVALGKPKDRTLKRPRDLVLQKGQVPPEKKPKVPTADTEKGGKGKGPVESEGFMNALSTHAARMKEKKKKAKVKGAPKSAVGEDGKSGEGGTPTSPNAPATVGGEGSEQKQGQEETASGEGYNKKKKRVSWAEDDNLTVVHYFEMDESERGNVSGHKSFLDAAQHEKLREREALEAGLMFSRDRLIEMIPWQRPPRLGGLVSLIEKGADSEQRKVQTEREEKVLAQLFLSKASLPPSALEPDPEPEVVETEPKLIPLVEPNAVDMLPQPMGGPVFTSPTHTRPPGQIPPDSPLQSPGTTIHQAQSLLNYYNEANSRNLPPRGLPPQQPHPHTPPHNAPPHQGPPHMQQYHGAGEGNMPPGPPGNFYNYQQDYPPGGGGGPPQGQGPNSWEFYGEGNPQFFRGRGGMAPRRPMRGVGYRGRGRGFVMKRAPFADSRICKHYLTHGCKLGARCRFLHCTPEELASQMAQEQQIQTGPGMGPPPNQQFPAASGLENMDATSNSTPSDQ